MLRIGICSLDLVVDLIVLGIIVVGGIGLIASERTILLFVSLMNDNSGR